MPEFVLIDRVFAKGPLQGRAAENSSLLCVSSHMQLAAVDGRTTFSGRRRSAYSGN